MTQPFSYYEASLVVYLSLTSHSRALVSNIAKFTLQKYIWLLLMLGPLGVNMMRWKGVYTFERFEKMHS